MNQISTNLPKRLIYGWFGNNPKPDKIKYCIDSWHRTNPDYEIVELNDDNPSHCFPPKFVKEAYEQKKWAYVADYYKLLYLHYHGGICLDADVELTKPLDRFLEHSYFTGQEINNELFVTAVMGAKPGHPLVRLFLDYYYAKEKFEPVPNTQFLSAITKLFIKRSEVVTTLRKRMPPPPITYRLEHNGVIYPQDYFCPFNHRTREIITTPNTHAIHHFAGSWK